jgi:hypothetical protein
MIRRYVISLIVATLLLAATAAISAQDLPFVIKSWPVALSESASDGATLGRVRALGMLQLPSLKINNLRFSQLSGLAWDDDDEVLYAISDKGYLFHLRPIFENDILTGVTVLQAMPLTELKDGKALKYLRADAEGLEVLNGRNGIKRDTELLVSFERHPRIVRYRPDGKPIGELPLPVTLADRQSYRDTNRMLESVCVDPALSVLTTSEGPLSDEPDNSTRMLFSLSGKMWRYPITGGFGISAMECLGDGRVLVLERTFGHLFGRNAVLLRLATLPATGTTDKPVRTTEVVSLDLAWGHQIDNFEGLTRHKKNRFFMISDDNDLFVQRTLLLYFELIGD